MSRPSPLPTASGSTDPDSSPPTRPGMGASPPYARVVLTVASLGFFLVTLDISIVNVSLNQMRRELGGGTTGQQWVIDGYTLLFAALLLSAGSLSDRVGPKRALAGGIALFLAASAACALAPSIGVLIAARCVQGVGSAVMLPSSMALIREAFPDPARRARALGVWAVGGAVAGTVGQPLGGLLTTLDWRWVCVINVPVCVGMLLFLRSVPRSSVRQVSFDAPGQVLAIVAMTALVWGLIEGGHTTFARPLVVAALVVAAAGIAAFVAVQARSEHPMMPLSLFQARGFRLALPAGFAFMVGNYGNVFVVSLYLQQHLGMAPLTAGLVFLPSAGAAILGNLASGPAVNRFGPKLPVAAGLLAMVVGLVLLAVIAPLGLPWVTALCAVPTSGGALAMPVVTSVVLDGVEPPQAGAASAVFNTFRQVGGAVAIAVFGALIADPDHFLHGMTLSLGIAAALLLGAALSSLRIQPRR